MRPLVISTVLFLTGFFCLQAGEKMTDLDRMQGTWLVVSLTEKGKAVQADETEILEIIIDKDTFTTFEKGKLVVKYQLKLDASKTPRQIDFTHLVGDDKGTTEPGIYLFEKDQLKLCMDDDKKGRPKVFEGKEALSYSVIVLKKKEKKK
jgi:uncharacterized protein (TIGR03067 family)